MKIFFIFSVFVLVIFLSVELKAAHITYVEEAPVSMPRLTNKDLAECEVEGKSLVEGQRSKAFVSKHEISNNDDFQTIDESEEKREESNCACGARQMKGTDRERIVGGVEADVNEFPWRCNLRLKKRNGSYFFFCGCSVLDNRFILTAAHCTKAVRGYQIFVDAGDHDLSTDTESENSIIPVKSVYQHEMFNYPSRFNNDIAILELSSPLEINRFISPICLPYKFQYQAFANATVTASGWGTEMEGSKQNPNILRKVDLPVLTTEECQEYMGGLINDNMFCTYKKGADTCQGDSGGSIDYKDPATGRYYLMGIVSFGEGCARDNRPGVYTKVTHYLQWITDIIGNGLCTD